MKKTISFVVDPLLAKRLTEFAENVAVSRSELLSGLIEKFLFAHEKMVQVAEPEEYVKLVDEQSSMFCATHLGVMMHFNFGIDFIAEEE